MSTIAFSEQELIPVTRMPGFMTPKMETIPIYKYPISPRENFELLFKHKGEWMPTCVETGIFQPKVNPENIARGFVFEANMMPIEQYGGPDMFGIDWVYVPVAMGSMEDPNKPHLFDDANEWEDKVVWPDPHKWDWKTSAEENKDYLDNGRANMVMLLNGAGFERLISFMGFEDAAVALLDEDQEDALHGLFQKMADLHCDLIDLYCEAYGDGISGFTYHDDWGSQKAPFFSQSVASELLVPYMKQISDHIKECGKIAELHSCGHIEAQIENIIAGGWQSWTPMAMNNTRKLYEEYGDKIILGVCDEPLPEGATDEEQAAHAEEFVKNYYSSEKPSTYSLYSSECLTEPYFEAVYRTSRSM